MSRAGNEHNRIGGEGKGEGWEEKGRGGGWEERGGRRKGGEGREEEKVHLAKRRSEHFCD